MKGRKRFLGLAVAAGLGLAAAGQAAPEPHTPEERLAVISPILESAITKSDAYDRRLEAQATASGVAAERLDLWVKLFLNHGKRGLQPIGIASAKELAHLAEGTWEMDYRLVDGQQEQVDSWQFNELVEEGADFATLESMTLEEGFLAASICGGDPTCSFMLGAYGMVTYKDVQGPQFGLAPGEVGVKMDFEGHLSGQGYPGFENDVRGIIDALWVKQGTVYRTATFTHNFEAMSPDDLPFIPAIIHFIQDLLPPYQNDAILEMADGTQTIEYEAQQSWETQRRTNSTIPVWDLGEYWQIAVQDPRYLSPAVARQGRTLEDAHHAATVHSAFKGLGR